MPEELPEERPEQTDDAPEDPRPATANGVWTEAPELASGIRSLACPTDDDVHAATAEGLYRFSSEGWRRVAEGDFRSVSLDGSGRGYAGGDEVLARLGPSGWQLLGGTAKWKIHAVHTSADGAWIAGSGWSFQGANGLLVSPKVLFVGDDLTIAPDRFYGSSSSSGTIVSVTGSSSEVVVGGGKLLERWRAGRWQPLGEDYFLTGQIVSVATTSAISPQVFATNGKEIAMPLGVKYSPPGGAPFEFRHLFAVRSSFAAVGTNGGVLVRSSKGEYEQVPRPMTDDLVTGCATAKGRIWVGGGTRVFALNR